MTEFHHPPDLESLYGPCFPHSEHKRGDVVTFIDPSGQKHRLREDGILRKERVLATISRRQFDENSPDVLSRHQALLSS